MYELKCKRQSCSYNKNCNCTAKRVEIKADTACKTFQPSNEAEVGEVEKVGQPPIRKNIEVGCHADCIFNTDEICTANGITVQTCNNPSCPICCTFMPR